MEKIVGERPEKRRKIFYNRIYDKELLQQIVIDGATEERTLLNLFTVIVHYNIISQHTNPFEQIKPQTLASYCY